MGTTTYTRNGLHARATIGMSHLRVFDSSQAVLEDQTGWSVDNSAVSATPVDFEVWLGGALKRDLSLNFVFRAGHANRARLHSKELSTDLAGGLTTVFVGAGMIQHLNPAKGWLVGISAGFERWYASLTPNAAPRVGGSGVAASLYGGHDWWVGPQTSFGLMARVHFGVATGDGRAEVGQVQIENTDLDYYAQVGIAASLSYF